MLEKTTALHTMGLQIEGSTSRGVCLSSRLGKPHLDMHFEREADVKPLYMKTPGDLQLIVDKYLVVTGLDSSDVLARSLKLELAKDRDIEAILEFQVEPLLPFPAHEGVIDWIKLDQSKEGTTATVVAAKKEHLLQHIAQWQTYGIDPEVISSTPAALASFSKVFYPSSAPLFVLNFASSSTTCVLACEGKLLATQLFRQGTDSLIEAYLNDGGDVETLASFDFTSFSAKKFPHLTKALEQLRTGIERTLFALEAQTRGEQVAGIIITGNTVSLESLSTAIFQDIKTPISTPEEVPGFPLTRRQLQHYAVSIGFALLALPKATDQTNFRQKELAFPDPWKRLKKPLAIYISLAIALMISLFLFGLAYIARQEDGLRSEYADLLKAMNRPFAEVEIDYSKKSGKGVALSLKGLSEADIQRRLSFLSQELKEANQSFPLFPNVPKVSDVLAWLSTHPQIQGNTSEESLTPSIKLENFKYNIVKRPEKNKLNEKYQVKIELEFSTPVPRYAREFHDALIAPNDFIDSKSEIKWSSTGSNVYRTSFLLKDRTIYP